MSRSPSVRVGVSVCCPVSGSTVVGLADVVLDLRLVLELLAACLGAQLIGPAWPHLQR